MFLDAWELSTHSIRGCNSNKLHNSAARVQNAIFSQVSKDLHQQTNSELLNRALKRSEDSLTLSIPLACFAVKILNRLFYKQYLPTAKLLVTAVVLATHIDNMSLRKDLTRLICRLDSVVNVLPLLLEDSGINPIATLSRSLRIYQSIS